MRPLVHSSSASVFMKETKLGGKTKVPLIRFERRGGIRTRHGRSKRDAKKTSVKPKTSSGSITHVSTITVQKVGNFLN